MVIDFWALKNFRNSTAEIYSTAFRRILEAQSSIYIDVLIVSEFINAYTRIVWRQRNSNRNFKLLRNISQFKPIAEEVVDNIARVLSHCLRIKKTSLQSWIWNAYWMNTQMVALILMIRLSGIYA